MAENKPLISPEELRTNILDGSFEDKPHSFYVVYDTLMDELIVKLVKPDHLVSAYFITDDFALLVDPKNCEVVGYQFLEFTKIHLQKFSCTSQVWFKENMEDHLKNYVEFQWKPEKMGHESKRGLQNSYLFYETKKLDEALATC